MTTKTTRRGLPLALALAVAGGCAAEIDGPTPEVVQVTADQSGTNVICTCGEVEGCLKEQDDVITLGGDGFAPLPVELLGTERLELPTVTLANGEIELVVRGDDPAANPAGVGLAYTDPKTMLMTLPPEVVATLPPGKYDVAVKNPNGADTVLPDGLEVVVGPTLDKIEPVAVCSELDTKVTLTGKSFREGATVLLGEETLPADDVVFGDDTRIVITVRKGTEIGTYDVTVRNPEGCASKLEDALTVNPPPTLESVEPAETCSGGTVTIKGTGFLPGLTVKIGTAEVTGDSVTLDGESQLTVNVGNIPAGGPYDVSVTNSDGCDAVEPLTAALTVTPGPVVVAVDPSTVYNKVNFPITIFGQDFDPATTTVQVGTSPPTEVTITTATEDRIDAVVPAGIAPGTYDITVSDGSCSFTFQQGLVVTDELTVQVCGIDPPFGYTGEKTAVTVTSGTGAAGCSAGSDNFASTPRAWLDIGGNLQALRAVAFVTDKTLTATVPEALTVGGPYDLLVQNPDGGIGLLETAFEVVDLPVPQIDSINPGSVDTQFAANIQIFGKDFRAPVKVELFDALGTFTELTGATVGGGGTEITVGLDVGARGLMTGAYVVRVTNTDQSTYSEFSALAITNPAGNLGAWSVATEMVTARRRHAMTAGRVSSAARFLYALGGDDGAGDLDVVDVGPLDKFGGTGSWFVQRYKLATARTALSAVARGRYLYVIGGQSGADPVASVERAMILDPSGAPEVDDFSLRLGGTLEKGAYYYRVAALLPGTDPDNPGGETLPSDPIVIRAIKGAQVSLSWKAVPTAVSYKVYRTPSEGLAIGQEQLLADGITATSYEDPGDPVKDASQTPLRQGATGVWVTLAGVTLTAPRAGAAVNVAPDGGGVLRVYVAGGRSTGGAVLDTVEVATLSADGATLGNFAAAAQKLLTPRERALLVVAEPETSPKVAAGTTYLFAIGGSTTGGALTNTGSVSTLGGGGAPGAWQDITAIKKAPTAAAGWAIVDTIFWFGGSNDGSTGVDQSFSCKFTNPPDFKNCNSLGGGAIPVPRMNAAVSLESAFFYLSGGGASDAAAEKTVYKTVY